MSSECTSCAIFGFIVLPFLGLCALVLPLTLVIREKTATWRSKAIWGAAVVLPLLLIVPGAKLLAAAFAHFGKQFTLQLPFGGVLFALSLALAVVFRRRQSRLRK